ncbi:uncharacterized protein IL334_005323 [Kwoniella shivajii]|uniref:Arrestin C-terminal-like domain-containing protein n=1 Tax=Kwoniella shivajii TaxID=564305 RepID=A0ABZ1D2U9_9TREE|nr:hypothetical protein IL334_005323 [Kwoniella shivajii]
MSFTGRGPSPSPYNPTTSSPSPFNPTSSSSSSPRGRPSSPRGRTSSPRPPPSYARSSLDRSPSLNPLGFDERPRVPPPIYLRSSSPGSNGKGSLKIHVPAWGVSLVRPSRILQLPPLEDGSIAREPPGEDTVLSGSLEVNMKERKKVKAISVGVQSVCRLHMGVGRTWEEDGIFERGVEILGSSNGNGNDTGEEGIWLEKGTQSFSFTIILPATLATTDHHNFGRVSYILTARVEGITSSSSFSSIFKASPSPSLDPSIPNVGDFERVIARSDRLASASASQMSSPSGGISGKHGASKDDLLGTQGSSLEDTLEGSAISIGGEGSPSVQGLYTRRQSNDQGPNSLPGPIPPLSLSPGQMQRPSQRKSSFSSTTDPTATTTTGSNSNANWMKGDLCASRALIVHANPSRSGGPTQLDIRKEGFVDGLGTWRFSANADVFSISAVMLISINIPAPSPTVTIFLVRVVLSQSYTIISPRTPNNTPHMPEAPKQQVIYQVGRPHRPGERYPARNVESLWRGKEVPGNGKKNVSPEISGYEGWKIRAVARLPGHDNIRPTTNHGTITPIRVKHELTLQVFYSLDGRCVRDDPIEGPGELRMMSVRMPIAVPSCCLTVSALVLPTYDSSDQAISPGDIDCILSCPDEAKQCMCGSTFAELGAAAMRRMQNVEQDELEERVRERANEGGNKEDEARRDSMSGNRAGPSGSQ